MEQRILLILRRADYFSNLTLDELKGLVDLCREETVEAGAKLIEAGQPANSLIIIAEGLARSELATDVGLKVVDILGPGKCKGTSALIGDNRYLMSVRMVTRGTVLRLDAAGLKMKMELDPMLGCEIYKKVCRQLRERYQRTVIDVEAAGIESASP